MTNIYSDIHGYWIRNEADDIEVFIIDKNGGKYNPNLILPNLLAVKNLRDYLSQVLEKHGYQSSEQEKAE